MHFPPKSYTSGNTESHSNLYLKHFSVSHSSCVTHTKCLCGNAAHLKLSHLLDKDSNYLLHEQVCGGAACSGVATDPNARRLNPKPWAKALPLASLLSSIMLWPASAQLPISLLFLDRSSTWGRGLSRRGLLSPWMVTSQFGLHHICVTC